MVNKIKSIEQPLNLAIKYLSYQSRTIYEMQEYIKKRGFDICLSTLDYFKKGFS